MIAPDEMRRLAREEAKKLLTWHLGLAEASVPDLVRLAHETLGDEIATLAFERARVVRPTRRKYALACLAALVVGTQRLGRTWWEISRERSDMRRYEDRTPARLLGDPATLDRNEFPLDALRYWIDADVADAIWGPPVAYVDLNSQRSEDRFVLPSTAREGDRLVVSFDPGARLDAIVVRRGDTLGSDLLFETIRESSPAETWWAWAILPAGGSHRLPGEEPGRGAFESPVDRESAARLLGWAVAHGMLEDQAGQPWTTAGDVLAALESSGWEGRFGTHDWHRAMDALADGDTPELRRWIDRL